MKKVEKNVSLCFLYIRYKNNLHFLCKKIWILKKFYYLCNS